ncbi:hypothetical protein F443_06258 [Phytophthora nicotianae P1569]|uniref:Uncharacterized protein n=1 Tax=Phytophthora nicotianae P1569 TaxID=1317065 RepID=V9FG91_PHYNI|nr:hypothetical protein F443_06258 [Phytophthora nicotianae P1569]
MDYYASRDLLRTQEDPEVARYVRYRANSGGDELNVEPDDDTFESDDEYEQDVIDSANVGDYDTLDPPTHPAQNIDMRNKSNPATNLAALSKTASTAATSISATGFSMSVDDVEKYMRGLKKYTSSDLPSANTISRHLSDDFPVLETRVQLLERAIEKSANRAPRSTEYQDIIQQSTQVTMPSLENVVVAYSLNRKQETMFVRMGHNLLQSLILPEQPAQQENAFLGGHPGAGKSRVIAALQALAIKWDMPDMGYATSRGDCSLPGRRSTGSERTNNSQIVWMVREQSKAVGTDK